MPDDSLMPLDCYSSPEDDLRSVIHDSQKLELKIEQLAKENERLREALKIALRQWKMYIEDGDQCGIESIDSDNIEAELYKQSAEAMEGK